MPPLKIKPIRFVYIISILLMKPSIAQIILTQSDMAVPGISLMNGFDTSYAAGPGPAGPGQSWDFSGLLTNLTNTINFKSVSGQSGASNFTGSNLCLTFPGDSSREFLIVSSSGFWVDGMYSSDTSNPMPLLKYDPAYELITFPATYGTSSNSNSQYSVVMPGSPPYSDSVKYKVTYLQNSLVDAWGTLSLPMGSYNVIRQNITAITIDSIYYYQSGAWSFDSQLTDTTYDYRWWTNGIGFPLVELTQSISNPYHGANFIMSYAAGLQIKNQEINQIKLFPNPASDKLNIIIPEGATVLVITDMLGNEVFTEKTNDDVESIDVSVLKAGIYSLRIISSEDSVFAQARIVVSH